MKNSLQIQKNVLIYIPRVNSKIKLNRRKKIETFRYSTVYINIISLIIALIVFFNINLFLSNFNLEVPKQDLNIGTEITNGI